MKGIAVALALLSAGLGGIWFRVSKENALKEQYLLEAPLKEQAEKFFPTIRYSEKVPDLILQDETGQKFQLEQICKQSRLTLLSGFRAADETSLKQLIDFREAYNDLRQEGLSVLVLTGMPREAIRDIKRRYAIPFPMLLDPGETGLKMLGAKEQPYSLLISPDMRMVFSSPKYRNRQAINVIIDKTYLDLTGQRLKAVQSLGTPVLLPPSKANPLVLNDLQGNPVTVPSSESTAFTILSTKCPDCRDTYQRIMKTLGTIKSRRDLGIVFVGSSISSAKQWMDNVDPPLEEGVLALADPADYFRRRLGVSSIGSIVLLDSAGQVLQRFELKKGDEYEKALFKVLSKPKLLP